MIIYKAGDIFKEKTEAIVNPVNCVGVMGKGLALQFKIKYPGNFKRYQRACELNKMQPGKMLVTENYDTKRTLIINFPTKRHWRDSSKIEDIQTGLIDLTKIIKSLNIKSIAIPPIGCGLGGLDWNKVRDLIDHELSHLNVKIIVLDNISRKNKIKKYKGD